MKDCIFCQLAQGKLPSQKLYEGKHIFAIRDINPVAPVHILVISKKHYTNLNDAENDKDLLCETIESIPKIAEIAGVKESGYRVISNVGKNAGPLMQHYHFHIIGGKNLGSKIVAE